MGMLLITHDLGIVNQMSDRVLVMYAGTLVETAHVKLCSGSHAIHNTIKLLQSVPRGVRHDSGCG